MVTFLYLSMPYCVLLTIDCGSEEMQHLRAAHATRSDERYCHRYAVHRQNIARLFD